MFAVVLFSVGILLILSEFLCFLFSVAAKWVGAYESLALHLWGEKKTV